MTIQPPTDEQLSEWQQLTDEATPGPWKWYANGGWGLDGAGQTLIAASHVPDPKVEIGIRYTANADFITVSRRAMPVLLAEVRRLQKKSDNAELCESAVAAVRRVLEQGNVPSAAYIDDHVANAIIQRDEALAEVKRLRDAIENVVKSIDIQLTGH